MYSTILQTKCPNRIKGIRPSRFPISLDHYGQVWLLKVGLIMIGGKKDRWIALLG